MQDSDNEGKITTAVIFTKVTFQPEEVSTVSPSQI
jgi:hypothetical protein